MTDRRTFLKQAGLFTASLPLLSAVERAAAAAAVHEVLDVLPAPREQVVHAHHVVTLGHQPLAQVRADEPGAAGHEHPHG